MKSLKSNHCQLRQYMQLARTAYEVDAAHHLGEEFPAFGDWRRKVQLDACQCSSTAQMNQTTDFDAVMLEFAIIAGDDYWINRLSSGAERRIRWVIENQLIHDLEYLEQQPIKWRYIEGICAQANVPPKMADCPAELLLKIQSMLDTHVRRLAKRKGIALADLPSGPFRKGYRGQAAVAKYRHDHHHHIKHGVHAA